MDFCFIKKTDPAKLLTFFTNRKKRVHDILVKKLKQLPKTPYIKFLLETPHGQERVSIYFSNFENALRGQSDTFISDLRGIGYIRAIEGYQLEDVWDYTLAFKQAFSEAVLEYNTEAHNGEAIINIEDISFVHELIDYSNYALSFSFIRRRDEIIKRRRSQIYELNNYAIKVVSIFSEKNMWDYASCSIPNIFGLSGSFYGTSNHEIQEVVKLFEDFLPKENLRLMLKGIGHTRNALAFDVDGNQCLLNTEMEKESFICVLAPINTGTFPITHIVCIHDQGRIFKFEKFDRNLFFQFCILTGSIVYNCRMVSEVSQKQEDLHKLTRSLMTVQENERKKIAADIHDTLTQTLTAIGYKALLCQDLAENDIERMKTEFNSLIDGINEALRQSRQIMSNLRPKILDDLGIIAAFKKVISDFRQDTNLKINFNCPEKIQVSPDVRIAFYRILQESLHNITKHAHPSELDIHLALSERNELCLMVQDDGRGFDSSKHTDGLGLMTMCERAEDLGGGLRVFSSLGEGCRIEARIPLKKGEVDVGH